ncbi:phage tail protein [Natronobiforma cellulositropha]|uniref:phage tail protein n=1 Tax=Natronobiforma cellulositropha TaxID=1679076 RepID=UPI0021D5A0C0|nr:phage tail protein [Natronobiforma cellulositropha]
MFNFTDTSTDDDDPYNSYRFQVEIDGIIVGGFTEVSGLRVETNVVEYREGGVNDFTHKFPDHIRGSNVVLRRGLTDYTEFFTWMIESTTTKRADVQQDVMVTLLDKLGQEVWAWEFIDAYPVRWEGPQLRSDGGGVSIEMVEITYERLETLTYSR